MTFDLACVYCLYCLSFLLFQSYVYMTVIFIFLLLFFFSSRRRHTRCALVTGVQTSALPISVGGEQDGVGQVLDVPFIPQLRNNLASQSRSEERRVGKECVSTCRSRWSPYH